MALAFHQVPSCCFQSQWSHEGGSAWPPAADRHFNKPKLASSSHLFQLVSFLGLIHPNSEVMLVNFIESCSLLLIYSLVKAKGRDLDFFPPLSE